MQRSFASPSRLASPGWSSPGRARRSTTCPTATAPGGASRTSPRRASIPAASAPRRSARARTPPTAPRSTASAASRSRCPRRRRGFNGELMRGFGLEFDGVDRFTTTQAVELGGVEISRAVYDQEGLRRHRELGPLARHVHQHDERAADDQGRVRRPDGLRRVRRELERDGQHVQRRRHGRPPPTRGSRSRRRSAGTTLVGGPQATVIGTPRAVRRRDDVHRQLALRHVQQPARRTAGTRATSRPT